MLSSDSIGDLNSVSTNIAPSSAETDLGHFNACDVDIEMHINVLITG